MRPPTSEPIATTSGSEPLDRARRDWLEGLVAAHAASPSATTALALAQGCWRCGEYAAAWPLFLEARDRAPQHAECHLALVNAAGMLARWEELGEALRRATTLHPDHPAIALCAARALIPGHPRMAREHLARFPGDVLCAAFTRALDAIDGCSPTGAPQVAVAGLEDRFAGLAWSLAHASEPGIFMGQPARVLEAGLDAARLPGLVIECGVYFGRSLDIIARAANQAVHGFDSFQGLPEAWKPGEGAGAYSTAGRLPATRTNVSLHAGWFDQTLPAFLEAEPGPIRLLHVDCDIYSSTRAVLRAVDRRLQPGSVIVFDDMLGYPGYEAHELRAFEEFVAGQGVAWDLVAASLLGREVAVRITGR